MRVHDLVDRRARGAAPAPGAGRGLHGRHADRRGRRRHLRPARPPGPQHRRARSDADDALVLSPCSAWLRVLEQYNPIGRAQRNVAHHYDLNDQLYDFFLDRDRQYSCAYFNDRRRAARAGAARQEAPHRGQAAAEARPARARHRLGLGRHGPVPRPAVRRRRDRRHAVQGAARRVAAGARSRAGSPTGCASSCSTIARSPARYDRIVSVGMFEHVGVAHYVEFFTKVKELLGRRRRHAAALDRPHGAARRHQHLAAQVHLPRRLYAGACRRS